MYKLYKCGLHNERIGKSMKTKTVKLIALVLAVSMCACMISACGTSNKNGDDSKVSVKIGYWPQKDVSPENYKLYEGYLAAMNEKYPEIEIIPDNFDYAPDTFLPAAASGQIPNLFRVPFTEVSKIVKAGYAADISEKFKEFGFDKALKDSVLDLVTVDGKYYGVPYNAYIVGLIYNIKLFEEAGLVDADGRPIYPTNFEELRKTAVTIKEKTGKAGFTFPTDSGWLLMSMAWSFGVDFMEQIDGKWTATFDSPEMINFLQYVSDLKWKDNVLPENILLAVKDVQQLVATDQAAFAYAPSDWSSNLISAYGMSKDNISNSPVVAGPAGACTQIGGDIWMISPDTTSEQMDAIFKWLELRGHGLKMDDATVERLKEQYKLKNERNEAVVNNDFSIFKEAERVEQEKAAKAEYLNVDETRWNTVYSDKLILKPEEPVDAQQLYQVVGDILQEILINQNADIPALVKQANSNFQRDFLDKNN